MKIEKAGTQFKEVSFGARRLFKLRQALDLKMLSSVLVAYLVTRFIIFFLIFVSSVNIPMAQGEFLYAEPSNILFDGLIRFDSWWYHNITTQGYSLGNATTGVQGNVAFFPLYPLLIKLVVLFTGNIFIAGLLISNLAFLVGLFYLYALARREFDEDTAGRAVFYLAAAPTSIFFAAMYTESLFVALVAATFYYAGEKKWVVAALTGALAAATRNSGVLLAAVIALEGMYFAGLRLRPLSWKLKDLIGQYRLTFIAAFKSWSSLAAASFVPMGLIGFMAYLTNTFGDPLAFIHSEASFGRQVSTEQASGLVDRTLRRLNFGTQFLAGQTNSRAIIDVLITLAFLSLFLVLIFKMRPAYPIFVGLSLALPLASGTVSSMTRYVLPLIPCYLLLAHWGRNRLVDRVILAFSLPLMGYFTVLFSHWYFAG